MNTLIEIKRNALNDLKIVGDISKLTVLLQGEHYESYILGFSKYIIESKVTDINEMLNGAVSCGIVDARKLFKAGKIFVIKRKDNVGYILKCQKDGGSYCCFGTEFTNLQESSDFVFADTFEQAVDGYIAMKSKQLEMQDLTEQKQVKESYILTIDESYQAKILELERKLKFAENQLNGQIQSNENLTEKVKQLQSNYLHACENYKQKDLQCQELIAENTEFVLALETCRRQISNYENTSKTLLEENKQFKLTVNSALGSPNLPKISEGTLEKLVELYTGSKKSMTTFDTWLVDCVIESLKIMPKHPIDNDTLQYLQQCFEARSKTASYAYNSLPVYLKKACAEFGKLEKIKAVL